MIECAGDRFEVDVRLGHVTDDCKDAFRELALLDPVQAVGGPIDRDDRGAMGRQAFDRGTSDPRCGSRHDRHSRVYGCALVHAAR